MYEMGIPEFTAMSPKDYTPEKPSTTLLPGQEHAFSRFREFVKSPSASVFILKGYAGTGKTTLLRHFIYWLHENKIKFNLLASTGRGAKILSDITGAQASTVHSLIYVFSQLNQDLEQLEQIHAKHQVPGTQLTLDFELRKVNSDEKVVYLVDEASMISDNQDQSTSFARYGSGNLLMDLFAYHPQGKFVFAGDLCQLPPVHQKFSPALHANWLKNKYHRVAWEIELREVIRQSAKSGILDAAGRLRNLVLNPPSIDWPRIVPLRNRNNILVYPDVKEFLEKYLELIINHGYNRATLICFSNKYCSDFNKLIRQIIFNHTQDAIVQGDLLMVTQNNPLVNLVNGDQVEVVRVGNFYQKAGLVFRETDVRDISTGRIHSTMLIETILTSEMQNLNQHEHQKLFIDFNRQMRKKGIKQGDEAFEEAMRQDPWLNGLRAVYGYALTCHKAQGGEWDDVFVFLDNKTLGMKPPGFYQWLYTAVTRARRRLHVPDGWFLS